MAGWAPAPALWSQPLPCVLMEAYHDPMWLSPEGKLCLGEKPQASLGCWSRTSLVSSK